MGFKRLFLYIGFTFLFSSVLKAQIINVESARKVTDTSGWAGDLSISGAYLNINTPIWNFSTKSDLQYKNKKHLAMFLTDWSLVQSKENDFNNALYLHLRYNYKINALIRVEAFTQYQFNKIKRIDSRYLLGGGPRFKLLEKDFLKIYFGSLIMSEWENQNNNIDEIVHLIRSSSYLSFTVLKDDMIEFYSTTYYQPSFSHWKNFRIFNEEILEIKITEILTFINRFGYSFESYPILDAPKSTFQFSFGLKLEF
ncbi:DUF481 domain-containing protein [Membranihabitans maritimus]|uniref:DUF481 domain-containing protein n=1 Tax=Membranihabitans maritimus TaxID=2904244 RepID=UPI001F224A38|nr:DUF481 domain-containing protein [Membranihabitans maritimus]